MRGSVIRPGRGFNAGRDGLFLDEAGFPAVPEASVFGRVSAGPESQDAMNGQQNSQYRLVITSPQGLHMRPAAAFAERARQFQSAVTVSKAGKSVNGKSPLDMLLLVAEQGAELTVEAQGPDAAAAAQSLTELLIGLEVAGLSSG